VTPRQGRADLEKKRGLGDESSEESKGKWVIRISRATDAERETISAGKRNHTTLPCEGIEPRKTCGIRTAHTAKIYV